jgi:RNA polymerase sigma factor (sigma-70 family)
VVALPAGLRTTDRSTRERALLERCRAGEQAAWAELLDDYERLVFSIPLRYGLSREDAADVAQVVFTELLQSLDSLREDERLAGWLATVARRQSWRVIERRKREPAVDELPEVPDDLDPTETWTRTEWLYDGLLGLDDKCRQLLVALYLEGGDDSYAEVARKVGRPIGSIGPTRARCLERLRGLLSP